MKPTDPVKKSIVPTKPDDDDDFMGFKKASPEGMLDALPLEKLESDLLKQVFEYISKMDKKKEEKIMVELKSEKKSKIESSIVKKITPEDQKNLLERITEEDLKILFQEMKVPITPNDIREMIWEADEDMDNAISIKEFTRLYKRCSKDQDYLEPRNFFNLVQFLMFDKDHKGTITEEQTLELLIIKFDRVKLDGKLEAIFGNEVEPNGEEKKLNYLQFIHKMNLMAIQRHNEINEEKKNAKKLNSKKSDDGNSSRKK